MEARGGRGSLETLVAAEAARAMGAADLKEPRGSKLTSHWLHVAPRLPVGQPCHRAGLELDALSFVMAECSEVILSVKEEELKQSNSTS